MEILYALILGIVFVLGALVGVLIAGAVLRWQAAKWQKDVIDSNKAVEERLQRSAAAHEQAAAHLERLADSLHGMYEWYRESRQ